MAEEPRAIQAANPDANLRVGERGVEARNMGELYRMAQWAAQSGLLPTGVKNAAQAVIILQHGAELGLSPMQALQSIAVINGRPSIWGDAMLALCMAFPAFEDIEETWEGGPGDGLKAVCKIKRRGKQTPVVREFGITDAKQAGLFGKQGPWSQYTKRMLQMRARSWALRDTFPDALKGIWMAEEAQDAPPVRDVDARVLDAPPSRTGALRDKLLGAAAQDLPGMGEFDADAGRDMPDAAATAELAPAAQEPAPAPDDDKPANPAAMTRLRKAANAMDPESRNAIYEACGHPTLIEEGLIGKYAKSLTMKQARELATALERGEAPVSA